LKAAGHYNRAYLPLDDLRDHIVVDSLGPAGPGATLAGKHAIAAAFRFQLGVDAVLGVEGINRGDRLGERDVDRLSPGEVHVKVIGQRDRADWDAVITGRAQIFAHKARLLLDAHFEVADIAAYRLDLRIGHKLDLGMARDLHHQRRENALRAVQSGEGL
jgi:hypothetical protein